MESQDDTKLEVDCITIEEVEVELKQIRNKEAIGLVGINSDLLKYREKDLRD